MELTTRQSIVLHEDGDMLIVGDTQGNVDLLCRAIAQSWMQPADGWVVQRIESNPYEISLRMDEEVADPNLEIVTPEKYVLGSYLIECGCSQKLKTWIVSDPVRKWHGRMGMWGA